jgi:ubiquinone biosynthesis protein
MINHRDRYRQIAEVLSRHSLGFFVSATGLDRRLPFLPTIAGHDRRSAPYTKAEHLRLALEQLGPTFVKLGQILSTQAELLPAEYQTELARLQDAVPPVAGSLISDVIRQELGREPEEVFATFDLIPLASASIGQAHAATLADGTELVVKIRRPGVVEQIEVDLEILQNLAAHASRHWDAASDYDLIGIAAEFAQTLRAELDYLHEGRSAERFAANFAGEAGVHIPRVFWDTSTSRVLTLERLRGINVSDLVALDEAGIDRRQLAVRAAELCAKMIFDDGFFHADPHPGNLFIEPDGRIGLIDFGMVGAVDDALREQLGGLLIAVTRKDPGRLADALLNIAADHGPVDRAQLRTDVVPIIALYHDRTLGEIPLGNLIREILKVLRIHHLRLPREMALLLKMILMAEAMGVHLDPQFRLGEVLAPYASRLSEKLVSPAAIARRMAQTGIDILQLLSALPAQLRRLQGVLDAGGPEVHLRAAELEPLVTRIEAMSKRVVVAMIAAALIRGVGELIAINPTRWRSWQLPLMSGGVGAIAALGSYLAVTWRRVGGRRP